MLVRNIGLEALPARPVDRQTRNVPHARQAEISSKYPKKSHSMCFTVIIVWENGQLTQDSGPLTPLVYS